MKRNKSSPKENTTYGREASSHHGQENRDLDYQQGETSKIIKPNRQKGEDNQKRAGGNLQPTQPTATDTQSIGSSPKPTAAKSQQTAADTQTTVVSTQPTAAKSQQTAADTQTTVVSPQPTATDTQTTVTSPQTTVTSPQPTTVKSQQTAADTQTTVVSPQPTAAKSQQTAADTQTTVVSPQPTEAKSQQTAADTQTTVVSPQPTAADTQTTVTSPQPRAAKYQPTTDDTQPIGTSPQLKAADTQNTGVNPKPISDNLQQAGDNPQHKDLSESEDMEEEGQPTMTRTKFSPKANTTVRRKAKAPHVQKYTDSRFDFSDDEQNDMTEANRIEKSRSRTRSRTGMDDWCYAEFRCVSNYGCVCPGLRYPTPLVPHVI